MLEEKLERLAATLSTAANGTKSPREVKSPQRQYKVISCFQTPVGAVVKD